MTQFGTTENGMNRAAPAKARGRRNRLWISAAVLAAAIAGVGLWHFLSADPVQQMATVTVERGDLTKTVTAVGSLQPKEYVDVGTQVSGQLQKVYVEIGDRVTKGDLVAEIDPTRYESTVRSGRANLQSLRAQLAQRGAELELARQQLARNERMLAEHAISQDTVDQLAASANVAEAAVAVLEAQIEAAEATLEGDLANLGYTRIYAPMDGTVVSQTSLEGQTVNAAQQAPVIVQIANLDVMTVWAAVAEADVNKIKPGMQAWFTTLGMSEHRWQGSVQQIQPTPETTNDVVLYKVLIDVDNTEQLLLPSMTVQVFFLLGEAKDVPLVALNALRSPPAGAAGVYLAAVMTEQGPQPRRVTIGLSDRTTAEVTSGLEVGDRVIVDSVMTAGASMGAGMRERRPRSMGPRL
jgi:membrane fusion protein, macrolide-specific efflux system